MEVTALEKFTKGRIKVFLNDELAYVLYRGEIQKLPLVASSDPEPYPNCKLYVGMEISEEIHRYILDEILVKRAKLRAMNILLKHDKSERQLRQMLIDSFYPSEVIDRALEYVKSYGYVDDRRFAHSYASYRVQQKSRKCLEIDLYNKGISKNLIDEVLDDIYNENDVDEYEMIRKLAEKKCHGSIPEALPDRGDEKAWNKLYRHLLSKGYSYENIKRALELSLHN